MKCIGRSHNSALVTDACAAALHAFSGAAQRGRLDLSMRRTVYAAAFYVVLAALAKYCVASTVPFDATTKEGDEFAATFCWRTDSHRYQFSAKGSGKGLNTVDGQRTKNLKLPVEKGEYIQWLWVKPFRGDILILFEASLGGDGRGAICRYRRQPWEMRWCQWIPAFNLVASVAKEDGIYVGGIGFLARVNANSGEFQWRQVNLYQTDKAFNSFGVPVEDQTVVTFAASAGVPSIADKYISLDRQTGKILRIAVAKDIKRSNIGLQRTQGSCAHWGR